VTLPFLPRCLFGLGRLGGVLLLLTAGLAPTDASGQAPLHLVDDETAVGEISFRFVGDQTFETSRLREQIGTQAPGFLTRLRNQLAFLPGLQSSIFQFDPLALQKDVVRLRQFYQKNGFPQPRIDYPASQLDTTANRIHIIFTIREGTPVTIREMTFLTADGTQPISTHFDAKQAKKWTRFRNQSSVQLGERYTDFKQTQVEDNVQTWLRNQGYAFAQVQSTAQIDSTAKAATLRFLMDPGPLARFDKIVVEGNESVSDEIARRELPFSVGDRFSGADVTDGQRALFDLDLFRVAIADVPSQPRDSTVTVRYRVRETKLRAYSGQVGYGTEAGVTLKGSWRHRNFQGDARSLLVGLTANTGFPKNPAGIFPYLNNDLTKNPNRLFRASVTFRQPYLLTDRLSGTLEPFITERRSPSLSPNPNRTLSILERLGLNERQFGLNTTLIYNFLPFRSLSLQHSLVRIAQFREEGNADAAAPGQDDLFNRSIFSLSGTFGKADDFINPRRGFILRPTAEVAGVTGGLLSSGIQFTRFSGEASGYLPLTDKVELAGRLFGGVLSPFKESRVRLTGGPDRTYQDRFSDYLFYAGGASDVRGWRPNLAGSKVLRNLSDDNTPNYAYRSVGTRLKLGANMEARLPFPGLGKSWRAAAFVDLAYMNTGTLNLVPPPGVVDVSGPDGGTVTTSPNQLIVGTGAGLRYQTPFGFLRLDVAYKLTPDQLDLRRPGRVGDAVAQNDPVSTVPTRTIRRFRLHFGIGRSF